MNKPNYTGREYVTSNGDEIGYVVDDTGYIIYRNYAPWFDQHEPYIPDHRKSYEENAIMQVEQLIAAEEETKRNMENEVSQIDSIEQTVSVILANQMMEV